jgi:lipoprotein NlpI
MDAETLFFQGTRSMEIGDISGAETCFRKAIQVAPDFAEAYANLGLLQDKQGMLEDAEICYRRSIALNPSFSENYLNLGVLLAKLKRFNEAASAYKQAISLKPHSPAGWSNLGVLHACMKHEEEAEQCYRTAIFLDESYTTARFNLSYLLLRQGRLAEGWQCLEARHWYKDLSVHFTCPRWQGEPLIGKSILISHEAGLGDVIQFCRYATLLKSQGVKSITLICHPALKNLFTELEDVDIVIDFNEPIPASDRDFWTPLLSIPFYCKTRLDSIPAKIPYLRAPLNSIEKWAPLIPKAKLRAGLVWKGNALFENDADRSLPSLAVLAPLWSVADIKFIGLQKGAGEDDAACNYESLPLTNLGPQLEDFADTAAVIACLDLVICVDTAVAHLAGALGKPCWVLLPDYKTDWRWLKDRTDSPWYPNSMRLFRQSSMGDWTTVVNEVVVALNQLVLSLV